MPTVLLLASRDKQEFAGISQARRFDWLKGAQQRQDACSARCEHRL